MLPYVDRLGEPSVAGSVDWGVMGSALRLDGSLIALGGRPWPGSHEN